MNDVDFLQGIHDGSLPGSELRHRGHLRLAWLLLGRHSLDDASEIVCRALKNYAQAQGAPDRYHETLTRFWMRIVNHAMELAPVAESTDELVERFPILLEKGLPYRHWSRDCFDSAEARKSWVPPDLLQLP